MSGEPYAPTLGAAIAALRQKAEAVLDNGVRPDPQGVDDRSPDALRQALHELQVHQIELELQNDELRRMQVELDAERARYFDLYDLAPVGYCTISEHGLILEANFTAANLLGLARSELVGEPLSRFIVRADQDIYYLCRRHLVDTGEPQACELRMMPVGGAPFWAHMRAAAAPDARGQPVYRLVLGDVSERKKLELALQEKNVELEKARQVADRANRAKSDFLAGMSHELRSPLNSILGFAQLMQAGNPPPSEGDAARIGHIVQAGWHLLGLINDVLDLAAVESGHLQVVPERVALPELVPDCLAMVENLAQEKGIGVHFSPCPMPCRVLADPFRLRQVIVNLLSNAIKYNRPGGSVEVSCQSAPGQRARVTVRDTGEGLSSEKIAQLFQPFNRLGREGGAEQGTGIGLVICRRLVELMQGQIGVDSTVGVGSAFWFELPQAPPV
ncbi:ATP-binding protein [Candidatus Skiveiella danica]|uniref:PAS domain-containing sensor histidine kinase n=1 Tax=Candidatus Skiveiella danica TaxID=3386177 RepID=UPI001D737793|nr:PAS domain S-box protein [Betaproteobacteria bacterium]